MTDLFKRRRKRKTVFSIAFINIIVIGAVLMADLALRDTFFNIAETRAVQIATEAANKALQQEVADENIQYQDFILIHKDSDGHIVLMQANTVRVNKFASDTTLAVQKALEDLRWQSFGIPAGQILGIPFFANLGPKINYIILPVGSVRVNVVDKFETAGINQTRHSIYLNFDTNVRVVIPSKGGEAVVGMQVPLVDSIIVGNVPSTFVSVPGGILSSGLLK
ncbi:sporulation protein YunB [Pelotomaculum propionicicum]|uniref:sporulation protein YunB n=1 Tax=Pelotomaculum propionicicum TaxID=258475 RepID=UPI003B7AF22F